MTTSIGSSLQNRSSKPTNAGAFSLSSGLGICAFAGIAAALIDVYLRLPLHLPGWRGLFTMGLLVAARQLSGRAWGASAAAFAAALTSLVLAGPPRFSTLAFLAPGLVIDAFCLFFPYRRLNLLVTAVAGGLGNLAKFLVMFLAFAVFAKQDGAVTQMLMPWISHFGFGFCGGLIAVLLTSGLRNDASDAPMTAAVD